MSPQSEEGFEAVSALIDGAVPAGESRELIARCARDAAWSRQWTTYVLVGEALRSPEVAAWHRPEFVARLRQELIQEPIYLLPKTLESRRRAWRGVALAAAVSALAFVLVPLVQPVHPAPASGAAAMAAMAAMAPPALEAEHPDDPEPLLVAGTGFE